MDFNTWIDTFIEEKGIDRETFIDVESDNGTMNCIPVGCVVDQLKVEEQSTQAQAKNIIVKIDFQNGDVMDFFEFLAKKMAINIPSKWD